jgi:hypothetical protein
MYAFLRGIPDQLCPAMVERLIRRFPLEPHADKITKGTRAGTSGSCARR